MRKFHSLGAERKKEGQWPGPSNVSIWTLGQRVLRSTRGNLLDQLNRLGKTIKSFKR